MERTRKATGVLHWKKIGGGTLRLPGRIIKPNQKFHARRSEIPDAFIKSLICLDEEELQQEAAAEEKKMAAPEGLYEMKPRGVGWWDVVKKGDTKPINEKGLRKPDAEELLSSLE